MQNFKKTIFVLSSFLTISFELYAADYTAKCPVISDTSVSVDHLSDRYLLIHYRTTGTQGYFDSLQSVAVNKETGEVKSEELFGQNSRGGFKFAYCNPDDREFLESIEKFNWFSTCMGQTPIKNLYAHVSLSKRKEGSVKISAYYDDKIVKREITASVCK